MFGRDDSTIDFSQTNFEQRYSQEGWGLGEQVGYQGRDRWAHHPFLDSNWFYDPMQFLPRLSSRNRQKGSRQKGRGQKGNGKQGSWLKSLNINHMRISRRSQQVSGIRIVFSSWQYWLNFLPKKRFQNVKLKYFVKEDVQKTCYPRCDKVWWWWWMVT